MMKRMLEQVVNVQCPYCGQPVALAVDVSAGSQNYIEDCNTCCRPMEVAIKVDRRGEASVTVSRDGS